MTLSHFSSEQEQLRLSQTAFPYNHPELLAQYRGQNILVVDEQIVAAGDVDYRPIFAHYRAQGKEPIIICVPTF